MARSQLYRRILLQLQAHWKALVEIHYLRSRNAKQKLSIGGMYFGVLCCCFLKRIDPFAERCTSVLEKRIFVQRNFVSSHVFTIEARAHPKMICGSGLCYFPPLCSRSAVGCAGLREQDRRRHHRPLPSRQSFPLHVFDKMSVNADYSPTIAESSPTLRR